MEMEFPLIGLILRSRNFQFIFIMCPFADRCPCDPVEKQSGAGKITRSGQRSGQRSGYR